MTTPVEAPASPLKAWDTEAKALVDLLNRAQGLIEDTATLIWEKPGSDRPEIADRVSIGVHSDPTGDTVVDARRIQLAEAVHAITHDRRRLHLVAELADAADIIQYGDPTEYGYWWTAPAVTTCEAIRTIDERKATLAPSTLKTHARLLNRYTDHLGQLVHRAANQIDYYHQKDPHK